MRTFLFVVLTVASHAAAQPAPGSVTVAPASGIGLYAADSVAGHRAVAARPAFGADAYVALGAGWDLAAGYRTLDPGGDAHRLHSPSLSVRRTVRGADGVRLALELGGHLTDTFRGGDLGRGPRLGASLHVPLSGLVGLDLGTSAAFLFPDEAADGVDGGRPFDFLGGASVALSFGVYDSRCDPPAVQAVAAPAALNPYERAAFVVVEEGRDATVVWTFSDGVQAAGQAVERGFVETGTYAYRVTVAACGGVATAEGTVVVTEPCWSPPTATIVGLSTGPVGPFTPVVLAARAEGTPPLSYRWRYPGGSDTTAAVALAFGAEGAHPVELSVTNCTGQTAIARTAVEVHRSVPDNPLALPPLAVAFDFESCRPLTVPPAPSPAAFARPLGRANAVHPLDIDEVIPRDDLLPFAEALRSSPDHVLVVEAYADTVHAPFNVGLSQGRAEVFYDYVMDVLAPEVADLQDRVFAYGWGTAPEHARPECLAEDPAPGCFRQRHAVLTIEPRARPQRPPGPLLDALPPPSADCPLLPVPLQERR